jgi:hypothetical protein
MLKGANAQYPNLNPFQSFDSWGSVAIRAEMAAAGKVYATALRANFAKYHGRTGKTAATTQIILGSPVGTDKFASIVVRMGGAISYVINPIPEHQIDVSSANALGHRFSSEQGGWAGRRTNYYTDFGPRFDVTWYQGGPESHSPDTKWYEELDSMVGALGENAVHQVSAQVTGRWDLTGMPLTKLSGRI